VSVCGDLMVKSGNEKKRQALKWCLGDHTLEIITHIDRAACVLVGHGIDRAACVLVGHEIDRAACVLVGHGIDRAACVLVGHGIDAKHI